MKNIIFSLVVFLFCTTTTNLFSQKGDQQLESSELRKKALEMGQKREQMIANYLKEQRPDYWQLEMSLKQRIQAGGPLPSYKENAMLSDLVIIGNVTSIVYHTEGPYHTWVMVAIDSIIKGKEEKNSVVIKLVTGPTDNKGGHFELGLEPKFSIGEKVLFFLSTIPRNLWLVGGPEYFANPNALTFNSSFFFEKHKVVEDGYEPRKTLKIVEGNVILPGGKNKDVHEFIKHELLTIN